MFIAEIEYDRPVRWTRYTGDYVSWTNLYTDDLGNSFLDCNLQDPTTNDNYEGLSATIPLTLIEGPVGSVSFPTGSENKVIFEFTFPTPDFEIPRGANWFVEWEDPDWGLIDTYEFNITSKTGDEPIEWVVPFE